MSWYHDKMTSPLVRRQLLQLGATLRKARLEAGLSQSELGALAGVSRQLIGRIEDGEDGHPHGEIGRVAQIAAALGYRLAAVPRGNRAPSRDQQAVNDLIGRLQGRGVLSADVTSVPNRQDDRDD
jgi:transcriptional regulator with XRE-family HTH domain